MIKLKVIDKLYRGKKLYGYTVQDECGKTMDIDKDQLKSSIRTNRVEITNMTLTSDGRLIGNSRKHENVAGNNSTGFKATTVFMNGDSIACVLVDQTDWFKSIGVTHHTKYEKLAIGYTFDTGFEGKQKMMKGWYDNIPVIEDRPRLDKIQKKSFNDCKHKFLDILEANKISYKLKVEAGDFKDEYAIIIKGYEKFEDLEPMTQLVHILIENAMYDAKIKVKYIDEDTMYVDCATGINTVKNALKQIPSGVREGR